MATTTGNDYDHITISDGTNQTIHYLKDSAARDNMISIQSAQPSSTLNKIWVTPGESEVQVPTYDEFSDLKSATSTVTYSFINGYYINTNKTAGTVVDLTPTGYGDPAYAHVIIDCNEGDIFTVCAYGGNAPRTWAFLASDNKLITKADNGAQLNGVELTAPPNAKKLIVNNSHEDFYHYVFKGKSAKSNYNRIETNRELMDGCSYVFSLEAGAVNAYNNVIYNDNTASNLSKRARVSVYNPLVLSAGDKIHIIDGDTYKFEVLYYSSGTATYTGWLGSDFTVPADGEYYFTVRRNDNGDATVAELMLQMLVVKKDGFLLPYIDKVGERIDKIEYKLPDYYYANDYFPDKLAEIQSTMNFSYGLCFAFITDTHFLSNSLNSKNMLAQIMKKTGVPFVIFGGDLAPAYASEVLLDSTVDTYFDYVDAVGADKWYAVHGNHDIYSRESASSSTYFRKTLAENYNILMRKQERSISNGDPYHLSYCIDIPMQDTRIIVLNSTDTATPSGSSVYSKWQIKWLASALQELSNKKLVIVSHLSPDSVLASTEASDTEVVRNMLAAYQAKSSITYDGVTYDFSSATNTIVFSLAGHSHADGYHFENNILSVTTTCDAYYQDDGEGAVQGTITEQAFDIYYVDYYNKTIKTVRVGRGSNRAWNYETGAAVS